MPKTSLTFSEIKEVVRSAIEFVIEREIKSNTLIKTVANNLKRPESPRGDSTQRAIDKMIGYARGFDKSVKSSEYLEQTFRVAVRAAISGVGNCQEFCHLTFAKVFEMLCTGPFNLLEKKEVEIETLYVYLFCAGIGFNHEFSLLITKTEYDRLFSSGKDVFNLKDFDLQEHVMVIDPWFESVNRLSGYAKQPFDISMLIQATKTMGENDGRFQVIGEWEIPDIISSENILLFNQAIQMVPKQFNSWKSSDHSKMFTQILLDEMEQNKKAEVVKTEGKNLNLLSNPKK